MVYGILKFINFGHGAVYMFGTYVYLFHLDHASGNSLPNWPSFIIAMSLSIIITAIFGMAMERIAYRPTRGKSRLTTFMSSVGMSLLVTYGMEFLVGPQPRPTPRSFQGVMFNVGGAVVTGMQIFMFVVGLILLIGMNFFVSKTWAGKRIRACSEDMGAAYLMGINVDRSISITFAIGSGLGAVAGILVGIYYNAVYPTMGWIAGLKGFICAVAGGIGSIPGAMLGGMLLGLGENLGAGFISSGYRDAIAFVILIIVMLCPTDRDFCTCTKELAMSKINAPQDQCHGFGLHPRSVNSLIQPQDLLPTCSRPDGYLGHPFLIPELCDRFCRAARTRSCCICDHWRLCWRVVDAQPRLVILGFPGYRRWHCIHFWSDPGTDRAPPARRLPGDGNPGIWRDRANSSHQLGRCDTRTNGPAGHSPTCHLWLYILRRTAFLLSLSSCWWRSPMLS